MAYTNPLEEYMADLLTQHRLKSSIVDADYQNSLTQSQAEEALALSEIDQLPFDMAARSYNMDPREWAGREDEARQRMKRAVSANYLQSRAGTVDNSARDKRDASLGLLETLTRLQSVAQQGLTEIERHVPRDAGLRSQLTFDPKTGMVTQVAKNIPDEDAVRNQELADYLQVPAEVVARQRTQERMHQNDYLWKQHRRQAGIEKDLAVRDRQLRADVRAEEKAQWVKHRQLGEQAVEYSKYSPQMVQSLLSQPDTPPEMQLAAAMGDAIRQGETRALQEKTAAARDKVLRQTASKALHANTNYQTQAATGNVDPLVFEHALNVAAQELAAFGTETRTFNPHDYEEDFGPDLFGDESLDQKRQRSLQRYLYGQ